MPETHRLQSHQGRDERRCGFAIVAWGCYVYVRPSCFEGMDACFHRLVGSALWRVCWCRSFFGWVGGGGKGRRSSSSHVWVTIGVCIGVCIGMYSLKSAFFSCVIVMQAVTLLKHQKYVSNHIVDRCCKQPGILLYHAVGTGKTYTALSIAMRLKKPFVVFCPTELVFMWKEELAKIGAPSDVKVLELQKMTDHPVKNKVVIVDEIHFWLDWLHNADDLKRQWSRDAYNNMKQASRRILLTGSPVVSPLRGLYDIGCLCNFAVGYERFPFSQPEFRQKYIALNKKKAIVFGWATELISLLHSYVITPTLLHAALYLFQAPDVIPGFRMWQAAYAKQYLNTNSLNKKNDPMTRTMVENVPNAQLRMKQLKENGRNNNLKAFQRHRKIVGIPGVRDVAKLATTRRGPFLIAAMGVVTSYVIGSIMKAVSMTPVKTLQKSKFWKDVGPIVSRFTPKKNTSPDFPKVDFEVSASTLTIPQELRWWEMSNQLLRTGDLKGLGMTAKGPEIAWESFIDKYETYLRVTRRIGIYAPKDEDPPKYKQILKLMKRVNSKHIVVYSELEGVSASFAAFLDKHNILHETLTRATTDKAGVLKRFELGKFHVLILSPSMYFGITIKGTRQLHVMEPILNGVTRVQLYGRVSRYKSHAHLPKAERQVTIYTHIAETRPGYSLGLYKKIRVGLAQYLKYNSHRIPGGADRERKMKSESYSRDIGSPDTAVLQLIEAAEDIVEETNINANAPSTYGLKCPSEYAC